MGIDPENPDYEPGDECTRCVNVLFNGLTPKYVEADISLIVKCPFAIGDPPNGTVLLTQNPMSSCQWIAGAHPNFITWTLLAGHSIFSAGTIPFFWFFADVAFECIDAFVNTLVCGVGPTYGESGYAACWWGPTIGP